MRLPDRNMVHFSICAPPDMPKVGILQQQVQFSQICGENCMLACCGFQESSIAMSVYVTDCSAGKRRAHPPPPKPKKASANRADAADSGGGTRPESRHSLDTSRYFAYPADATEARRTPRLTCRSR